MRNNWKAKDMQLDWKRISGQEFIGLSADVLRSAGFTHVHIQNGAPTTPRIDVFATELVPFTFGERRSLRWAIQCKFSVQGRKSTLRSDELQEIDSILRSECLSCYDLRGYMLVTNRTVAHDVTELLHDKACRFGNRAMVIREYDLVNLLDAHGDIFDTYFGEHRHRFAHLGPPVQALTTPCADIGPKIIIQVEAPFDPRRRLSTEAVVDVGSSLSMLPESVLKPLGVTPCRKLLFQTAFGQYRLNVYDVVLKVAGRRFDGIQAVGGVHEYGLIGINVLANFVVLYDGPKKGLRLWHGIEDEFRSKHHPLG
jgi:hypothetical protein